MSDWFDDDAFWETFESYMFTPERIESARVEVDGMIRLLGIAERSEASRPMLRSRTAFARIRASRF